MVKIRLFRTGTTKRPLYRVVAVDSRKKRQARVLENLGTYDPCGGGKILLNGAAYERWIGDGAQASATVGSLFTRWRKEAASEDAAQA